jgi:hypothetical protein
VEGFFRGPLTTPAERFLPGKANSNPLTWPGKTFGEKAGILAKPLEFLLYRETIQTVSRRGAAAARASLVSKTILRQQDFQAKLSARG